MKKITSLILAVCILASIGMPAVAVSDRSESISTCALESFYSFCSECGEHAYLVCYKWDLGRTGTLTDTEAHTSTCTIKYYQSNSGYQCTSCGNIDLYYAPDTGLAEKHDCYMVHTSCGKGTLTCCTLDYM